jgi:hypothetical protein
MVTQPISGVENLWPQSAEPRPGWQKKDKLENALHRLYCGHRIRLRRGQGDPSYRQELRGPQAFGSVA